ncbi:MAG TPA: hypothetical protein VMW54_10170 [Terriglobia bacterium]|nr:hypothetical protein [Terriglobia bacterium]
MLQRMLSPIRYIRQTEEPPENFRRKAQTVIVGETHLNCQERLDQQPFSIQAFGAELIFLLSPRANPELIIDILPASPFPFRPQNAEIVAQWRWTDRQLAAAQKKDKHVPAAILELPVALVGQRVFAGRGW